jgi:hypothetical protein
VPDKASEDKDPLARRESGGPRPAEEFPAGGRSSTTPHLPRPTDGPVAWWSAVRGTDRTTAIFSVPTVLGPGQRLTGRGHPAPPAADPARPTAAKESEAASLPVQAADGTPARGPGHRRARRAGGPARATEFPARATEFPARVTEFSAGDRFGATPRLPRQAVGPPAVLAPWSALRDTGPTTAVDPFAPPAFGPGRGVPIVVERGEAASLSGPAAVGTLAGGPGHRHRRAADHGRQCRAVLDAARCRAADHGRRCRAVLDAARRRAVDHGRQLAVFGIAAAVSVVALSVGLATASHLSGVSAQPSAPVAVGTPSAPTRARDWVLANLDPGAPVLAPAAMAAALAGRAQVLSYGSGPNGTEGPTSVAAPDYHCCAFLIVAGTDPGALAAGLPAGPQSAYARSRALATFTDTGPGNGQVVQVRQIVDATPADLTAAVQAEQSDAADAGRRLAAGSRIQLGPVQRAQVTTGEVDSRLLLALVGLTGRHSISVSAFPQAAEEAAAGAPARTVVIDGIDGAPVVAGSPAVQDATAFLAAQVGPYRPALTEVAGLDGRTELTVGYPVAGPVGLPAARH